MGYAVLHLSKGKGSGAALGNHIDRKPGKEHSYKNADPKRKKLNSKFEVNKYTKMNFSRAVEERIKDGYKSNRKIRTDSVKYCNAILSGSHVEMLKLQQDPKAFKKWIQKNYTFMANNFGAENIIRFDLHMDEKTPHLHCCFVPILDDGRLSAKEVFGDRKHLQELQDEYAIAMMEFGLKRGLRSSGQKHETAQQYTARINNASNPVQDTKLIENAKSQMSENIREPKMADRLNPEKYREEIVEEAQQIVEKALKHQKINLAPLESENARLKQELARQKGHITDLNRRFGEVNDTEYSVKHGKDEILFQRGKGVFKVSKEIILRNIQHQNYIEKVRDLAKRRLAVVSNAYYQKVLEQEDLSYYNYDDVKRISKETALKIHKHSSTEEHTIESKKIEINFYFKETEDGRMTSRAEFPDFKDESKNIKVGYYISDIDDTIRNLTSSLFKESQKRIRERHEQERKEERQKGRNRGYDGGMSM